MQSLCGGWLWLGASQDEHQGTGTPATSSVGQASAQLFPCRPVPSPKERCCRAVYVPCTAPGMKLDKEMAAPAAAPAGRSGEGDPPREVKALAPCPGTVPAHDQLLSLPESSSLPCAKSTQQMPKNTRQSAHGIQVSAKRSFAVCFLPGTRQKGCRVHFSTPGKKMNIK